MIEEHSGHGLSGTAKVKTEIIDELRELEASSHVVNLYGETLTVDRAAEILNVSKAKYTNWH